MMFDQAMARIAGRFGRVEPRATARSYLLGLLSKAERKNCWQLAEQAGPARPGPMQRLRYARWDADAVRDGLRPTWSTTSVPTARYSSWTRPAS
jgi:SRSO17 transposase